MGKQSANFSWGRNRRWQITVSASVLQPSLHSSYPRISGSAIRDRGVRLVRTPMDMEPRNRSRSAPPCPRRGSPSKLPCLPHHPWTTAGTRPFGKKLLGSRHSNPTLRPNMTRRSRCAPFYTIERVRYPRPFSHWMNVTKMMARFARSCHSPAPLTT